MHSVQPMHRVSSMATPAAAVRAARRVERPGSEPVNAASAVIVASPPGGQRLMPHRRARSLPRYGAQPA
jgi:hypothetical protein